MDKRVVKEDNVNDSRFDVDEALERLEEINKMLAAGDMPLAESVNLYKEGVELAEKAKICLEGVEQELKIVNEEDNFLAN